MGIFEFLIIAIVLSLDAFAVSVCKGLATQNIKPRHLISAGLWFGGFQALMPTIGYFLGAAFESYITSIDHWVAFILLSLIGLNMIKESFGDTEENSANDSFSAKTMLVMAVATSIDALAVGITFAFTVETVWHLIFAVSSIGVITFIFSATGVKLGSIFGTKYNKKATFTGGVILIILGLKLLLEGLGVIA